jgi:hypothetical protein
VGVLLFHLNHLLAKESVWTFANGVVKEGGSMGSIVSSERILAHLLIPGKGVVNGGCNIAERARSKLYGRTNSVPTHSAHSVLI